MKRRRSVVALAVVGAFVVTTAPPASAATRTYEDDAGDVQSFGGSDENDPRADILGLTVQNDADVVRFTIQMAEAVATTDDAWTEELFVAAQLIDVGEGASPGSAGVVQVIATPSGPFVYSAGFCDVGFTADTSTDRYTLSVPEPCVRAFPRSGSPITLVQHGSNVDAAPYGDEIFDIENEEEPPPPPPPVSSAQQAEVRRLAGTDRYLTGTALSGDRYGADEADAVVLASATSFPDALAGGPLASVATGPVLLTGSASLDARTKREIDRVLAPGGTVYVLGGTAALSDQVVSDVRAPGYEPQRLFGANRFETAVAIARETAARFEERFAAIYGLIGAQISTEVVLADGRSFSDALIAGASAAQRGAVLLLTDGADMPTATSTYLANQDDPWVTAIGTAASTAYPDAETTVVASSPAQLSRRVAEDAGVVTGTVAIASEDTFADALAGGGHIGGLGLLLLTDGTTLSPDVASVLEEHSSTLRDVVIYGGTAAISAGVEQAVRTAVGA